MAGYSLGGNLALKLAGEYGDHPPDTLIGVAAISPIIEIGECTRALERRENVLYEWNFVRELKKRMERKERHWPGMFDLSGLKAIKTVREFDNVFTAPHFGFKDAEDYYYKCSAMRIVDRIAVPALVITAEDDPFVPQSRSGARCSPPTRTSSSTSPSTAATAGSSARERVATMAIGPRVRS